MAKITADDWERAEEHLKTMEQAYMAIAVPDIVKGVYFATFAALWERLRKGERTKKLYNEIMELE